jgi:hypothetical protein
MKRRALLAATALLAACSSVPVSTMWRLRNFTPDKLFELDPTELRAAAYVDTRAVMKNAKIELDITPADGSPVRTYVIPLDQPVSDPRLERPAPDRRWYAFALSPQGLAEYQRIKREYAMVPKGSRGTLKISAADDNATPPDLKRSFPLRIDILLDPAEGYFTLISETRLDLSQQNSSQQKK